MTLPSSRDLSTPLSVEGVKIGITVKQRHENVFKISVRSDDEIDASAFCREFGGGGHMLSRRPGSLEEASTKLQASGKGLGLMSLDNNKDNICGILPVKKPEGWTLLTTTQSSEEF